MSLLTITDYNNRGRNVDWKLTIASVVMSFMVFIRDLGIFMFTPVFFITVVTVFSIILSYKSVLRFFFFLIPFGCGVHGLILVPLFLALVIKAGKMNVSQVIFTVAILIIELVHFLFYPFPTSFSKYIIYGLNIALFFYVIFDDKENNEDVRENIRYYVLGTVVCLTLILVHSAAVFGVQALFLGVYRIGGDDEEFVEMAGDVSMQITMNANTVAYFSVTAIALMLYVKCVFHSRLGYAVSMILLVFAGAMSTSRTWLMVTGLMLIIYFIFSKMKGKLWFVVATFLLFFALYKFTIYTEALFERFGARFTENNLQTGGLRTELFAEYNMFMRNNPRRIVFGTGAVYYKQICNVWNSVHCGLQQIYVCYGLVGLLIYLTAGIMYYYKYPRVNKSTLWLCLPFLR